MSTIPAETTPLCDKTVATWAGLGPSFDRSQVQRSIVHIGVGGFHRAHLATYVHELCEAGHTAWGIVGSGVMAGDATMDSALRQQDGLYTLIVRDADQTSVSIIGSIVDYLHAYPDARNLIEAIASPETQIVSLTVTEGGYPIDDVTAMYAPDSPVAGPASAFGILAAGLDLRREQHGAPVTVLSCDNIMANGHAARTATLGEAAVRSQDLVDWIGGAVSFPNSMVDRITPATVDTDRSWLAEQHGIEDQWPVVTEPFRQWVIEDNFAGARLPLEELDVIVTDDVEPYEHVKLRLLNAGHSCLAYLAALDGMATVDQAMADPHVVNFVRAFLDLEARPVVPPVRGIDLDDYVKSLITRFSNPAIGDQISRLCLDGSAKFPKFLLPTVRAQLAANGPIALSALALAGWCQYLLGVTDHGEAITLATDPLLDEAVSFAFSSQHDPRRFLEFGAVFDEEITNSERFCTAFDTAVSRLRSSDVRSAIAAALGDDEHAV